MKRVSRLQNDCSKCFVCGKGGELHPHHIFNGAFRKKSEEDGYVVWVHNLPCHRSIHDNAAKAMALKRIAQEDYELTHTREEFMRRYRKNYESDS